MRTAALKRREDMLKETRKQTSKIMSEPELQGEI
jgi:hypothetical protein